MRWGEVKMGLAFDAGPDLVIVESRLTTCQESANVRVREDQISQGSNGCVFRLVVRMDGRFTGERDDHPTR